MSVDLIRIPTEAADLAVLVYHPRRPRNVWIVAGHGYSSSKHNLDFLCAFLASHGYGVYSLDFPGHKLGASGGTLSGIDDLVDSMRTVTTYVREHHDGPIYVMGHSMGAMTSIFTAAEDPRITGVISIATGFGRPSAIDALQGKGATDFRSSYVDGLPLPDLVRGVDERFAQALPKLEGRSQLYVAAERDAMVNAQSVRGLYDRAPEPKMFVTVSSDHTYAAENSRGEVLQWLNERHPRT
ncbi:MAG: alpha/beta fold hydrolase [Candidatus Eremiobacteraeota bacterium]|nr:alpha/beta fold hydrolase [Candidatus Eremiobacteraeota bacterium]